MSARELLAPEELSDIKAALTRASPLIQQLESKYKSKVLVCFLHDAILMETAYRIHKILRRMPHPIEDLTILLESGGGDLNSAHKIVKMFNCHAKRTRIIVPFYAKSAASLLALGGDELVACRSAELGSIDPQVRDPVSGAYVPAHSIKEAVAFIEEASDMHVKLQLSDKLSPLLIGAYRESAKSTKQHLDEILSGVETLKTEAVYTFTDRFLSHGYPIDKELLKEIGLKFSEPDEETEALIGDLHEIYEDTALAIYANHPAGEGMLCVLQSNEAIAVVFKSDDYTNKIADLVPAPPVGSEGLVSARMQPSAVLRA